MPKTKYAKKEDIPADQLGCYSEQNGEWVLTKLDNDHPVVVAKNSLETTQTTLKTTITELQNQVATANSKMLPEGMVAVAPIVKELGEAAQGVGLNKKEIPTLKTRADQAESKLREKEEAETINSIADETGRNRIAFAEHVKANNLKFETKTEQVDGKDVTTRLVVTTDGTGAEVKTSVSEYLKTKASHIAPAKKAEGGGEDDETIDVIDQQSGEGSKNTGNPFDAIRNEVKKRNESTAKQNGGASFADKFYNRN